MRIDGAQVRGGSLSLKEYVGIAYRVKISQISGPDWIASELYDIAATLPAGSKPDQVPEMLQALLADRFQLKLHREKKDFPVYALMIGKGPLKLKESPPDSDTDSAAPSAAVNVTGGGSAAGVGVSLGRGSSYTFGNNRFEATKLTMPQFAANLERFADRPIIDMTELKGRYDFAIDFSREDYQAMLIRAAIAAGVSLPPEALRALDGVSGGGLADAIQQLGLKLDSRKAPLDTIVIDEARKTPTAN